MLKGKWKGTRRETRVEDYIRGAKAQKYTEKGIYKRRTN